MRTTLAAILLLLRSGRPAHVARLIVAVVVDAIDRMYPRRTQADVSNECFKAHTPLVAHANPATAVVGIFRIFFGVAAFAKMTPATVFRRFFQTGSVSDFASRMTVSRLAPFGVLVFVTAAGFNAPVVQIADLNDRCAAAVTLTEHAMMFVAVFETQFGDNQPRKTLTDRNWQSRPTHNSFYFTAQRMA